MGEKKVTMMVLKVDLQCCKCQKKVKNILCKIPQVQDQIFNEKENIVTIKVVCSSPEKIMQNIRCKGGDSIECIKILPPPEPQKKPTQPEKTKDPEKSKEPKALEKPEEPAKLQLRPPAPTPEMLCIPATAYPPAYPCCRNCAEGRDGGPCHGGPPRWPVCDSWARGCYRGYYRCRCTVYICEENPNAACTIM